MSTLLVDADIVAYQIASVTEEPIRWDNEIWTLHSDEKECVRLIDDYYIRLSEETQCDKFVSCLSDKQNFRKKVLPTYKQNREATRKPLALKFCREYINDKYNGMVRPNLEADDLIGILATSNIIKGSKVICSIDKDLDQIAGLHFNPKTKEFYNITILEGEKNFYKQVLIGDATDNYKGCPSYGEVKASKVLNTKKNFWNIVLSCFKEQGLTKEDALVQARCARILQNQHYDFKKKQPILWSGNGK